MHPLSPAMESGFFDEPPSYAGSRSPIPSPSYSPSPRASELVVRSGSEATCLSSESYVYRSKHIAVNLGPKIWGTSIPVYGNNASVEGTLTVSGEVKGVTSICVKLQGIVTNTYSERGLITGSSSVDVLGACSSFPSPDLADWSEGRSFLISFPATIIGKADPLPPSSSIYHPGVTCAVKYGLKVTLVRKGLRRNESLKIPLLYLPRTFARGPFLSRIPRGPDLSGVYSVPLRAYSKRLSIDDAPTVILVLPSTLSFASYEAIPLSLSVAPAQNAAITKLLLSVAKVQLIRRSRTWINGGRNTSKHVSLLATAETVNCDERPSDANIASYELQMTRPAAQKSWAIDGVAEQQYYIHVAIKPPSAMEAHLPTYECEQLIEITTDAYESPEREVVELGGSPTPAIGTLGVSTPYYHPDVLGAMLFR